MATERAPWPKRTHPTWHPEVEPLAADEAVALPLLGLVSAGQPMVAAEVAEQVWVPARLVRRAAQARSFALVVRGESMIDEAIANGDLVVMESRPTAESGETVVARLDGYQVTLKRFYREGEAIRLQPANEALEPLRVAPEAVEILGVISGVVRLG